MDNTPPIVLPIQLTPAQVRPIAYRVISKKHGLNLKSQALEVLSKFLGHHFGNEWRSHRAEKSLDEISKRWKEEDRGIFVDGEPLAQVIKDYLNAETATQNADGAHQKFDWREYFKVVNITDQRRFVYDRNKKNFTLPAVSPEVHTFASAESLTNVFASRFNVLKDKLYRNDMFQPSSLATSTSEKILLGNGEESTVYTISPIKNMLGRSAGSEFFLFGLLEKQAGGGPWTLYDTTASINLEFTETTVFRSDHYYTSGSFVICHGHYMDDFFQVVTLGSPLPERREYSQVAYGNIDFYDLNNNKKSSVGTRIERIDQSLQHILEAEENNMPNNRVVVFGADIFLDKLPVLDALKRAFLQLEKDVPIALVLSGSFISQPVQPHMSIDGDGRNAAQMYRDGMNALADIFQSCPNLASKTKVIMIPGPNDPWHSSASTPILPYNSLPSVFTGRVDRAVKDIEFATNPSRLCYLSQEIYMYRGNIGEKFRKWSLDTEGMFNNNLENDDENMHEPQNITVPSVSFEEEEREADLAGVIGMVESNNVKINQTNTVINNNNEFRRVMATILDQCHISPFTLSKAPVIWESDQAISLSQWPTCFVLMDPTTPPAKQVYEGCHVMNPGPFYYNNKSNWLEFWPSSGEYKFVDLL